MVNQIIEKVELIEPDYEGIAKVLSEIEKLYKVSDNKEMLDFIVRDVCTPKSIIKTLNK